LEQSQESEEEAVSEEGEEPAEDAKTKKAWSKNFV
jgi:hypothetical protein